jgi:hypothetical protein
MNFSTGWRARKTRTQAIRKPKVRWEVLGLPTPLDTSVTISMEDIRRQVSNLASRGLGEGTRSDPPKRAAKVTNLAPASRSKRYRETMDSPPSSS